MKSIVLVLFLVLNNIVFAQVTQEWVSIYAVPSIDDNAWPAAMTTDNDGNVYVTGTFVNEFGRDYLTIKYNSAGVEQWAVRYDQLNVDYFQDPRSIAVDGSGNVYVTGVDNGKAGTIKYDTNGIEQWIVKYPTGSGSGSGITVKVDNNGNVYVMILAGGTVPNAIIKYNPDGVEQWSTSYSSATNTQFKDMVLDDSANVYVTGIYWGGSTSYNYITIKYNTNGSFQWASTYIGPSFGNDTPVDITVDDSANVYVTGTSPQAGTGNDFLTVKYSSSGETLWTARYDGLSGVDEAVGLEVDNSGNVYVTGQSYGQGGYSYATVKYNSSGTEQWVKRFLGEPKGIVVDAADNVFVTGRTWGPASSSSITTIKYNPNGVAEWVGRFDSTGVSLRVAAVKIVPDDNDNIYVAGILRTEPSWANQNIVTIKYSQGLKITSPIAGEKWIAGETDTIKWTGGQAGQFLNIKLSTDGGNNYTIIAAAISAEYGYYVWEIPEDLLSRKCKILIEDASTPNINTVSGLFKIKAYELIRVSATGDYEPFQMLHHNWSFENGYGMWDSSYYQQFDYKNGIDPYTGQIYASDFTSWYVNAKPEDFPSWPIFVRVFGADRCYLGGGPNPVMLFRWAAAKGKYGGSCYGFAISSLLAFENKQNWINRFKVPDFIELYSRAP